MSSELQTPHPDYREWLADIKGRYRHVQLKAAVVVNNAVLEFYWDLGADILARQSNTAWGQGFLTQLSADLMNEFPGVAGFSKRNLEKMRRWVSFWSHTPQIAKQPASQLMGIPWWHHVVILTKCKEPDEALYYVQQTQAQGWSRSVLTHQIESGLWQREGRAITNFAQTLPEALRGKLPYIEQLEQELGKDSGSPEAGGGWGMSFEPTKKETSAPVTAARSGRGSSEAYAGILR